MNLEPRPAPRAPRPSFEAVIGLEIHAQLRTATKIFCGCSTAFGAPPNSHVCPVCLGLPGALPVLNEAAVDAALITALALNCRVPPVSVFARKNYFYPDLPKGYQISQYEDPLAVDGAVTGDLDGRPQTVRIRRVHLEEDAGKSLHEGFPDSARYTYVDYNRAGVPLIEIVTEPDLRSASAAAELFTRLRAILVAIGVNDGNMETGSLRCDANVSVRAVGSPELGVKVEVKNLNSFRFLQKALEFEVERQADTSAKGGRIVQETRLFDAANGRTHSMRSKEEAHDYRYFPEPDLPPLVVSDEWVERLRARLPELPDARMQRFITSYSLPEYDARVLTQSMAVADYFEGVARHAPAKAASNWVMGEVLRRLKGDERDILGFPVAPEALAELIQLVERGRISGSVAKEVFEQMRASGDRAQVIVEREGLVQVDDEDTIVGVVEQVIAEHQAAVTQYRGGKLQALGFLVGQVMRRMSGKANPKRVNEVLRRELDALGSSGRG
ncbi:MAG: Asp-tRNA(Asn)/Glu-tRNA(Gln) amidotransferase subunit GatB [Luteitalea sp.]|nr:Asp-tRNA(Asn)/Glu-tRNA(Gln) amidotransferase subunit GatB [Luteitalea sp.]